MRRLTKISAIALVVHGTALSHVVHAKVGPDSEIPSIAQPALPGTTICLGPGCGNVRNYFGAGQSHQCGRTGTAAPRPLFRAGNGSRPGIEFADPAVSGGLPWTSSPGANYYADSPAGGDELPQTDSGWPLEFDPFDSWRRQLRQSFNGVDGSNSFGRPADPQLRLRLFPLPDRLGLDSWPGVGHRYGDIGYDAGPAIGTLGDLPQDSRDSAAAALGTVDFSSLNVSYGTGRAAALPDYGLHQQFDIGGTGYATYLYPSADRQRVENSLRSSGFSNFMPNPCRVVLVPQDPHFVRTHRSSWGDAMDDQWAIRRVGYTDDSHSAWHALADAVPPVVIAVVDTGIDWHHADIDPDTLWRNPQEVPDNGIDDDSNGYVDDVMGWNFVERNNKPWDFDGHGTIVAGIIGAAHNDIGIAGINPNARIMVLKAINNFGTSRASFIAEAVAYAVDNGAQIINLSVGGPTVSNVEQAALDYARENGVLVIAASGNEGIELTDYGPGGSDSVVTVGATHVDNRAAAFSNFGDQVDIVAPGVDVLSLRARFTDANFRPGGDEAYAVGDNVVGDDRRYIRASGTSFSTPIVSATASLLMAKRPELSADEVRDLLLATADDVDRPGRDPYAGHGMVNARTALAADPGFAVTAELSSAEPVTIDGVLEVHVRGTIDAPQFKRAWVQIGEGEDPRRWKAVGQKRKYAIHDGVIARISLAEFQGGDLWQVVVSVEDKNGVVKRDRLPLRIR